MSLITRCPACGTMFRVVPDQLRISEGWVRCGHCSEVFNASAHLQSRFPVPEPEPVAAPVPVPVQEAPVPDSDFLRAAEPEPVPESEPDAAPGSLQQERPDADAPEASSGDFPVSSGALLVSPASQLPWAQEDEDALDAVFRSGPAPVPAGSPAVDSPAVADAVPVLEEDLSFVQDARRKAFWRRPLIRVSLALMVLLLTGVLALQVAVHERDRLAAMEPQLRPWLTQLCDQLGCTIAVPRQIESVVIDSSTFSKVRPDAYRLSFTIRNTSATELATPAVEITLTDMQEQAVVRRVFLPRQIGASTVLPARGEWSAVINLGVDAGQDGGRIAGYRLLAFYP